MIVIRLTFATDVAGLAMEQDPVFELNGRQDGDRVRKLPYNARPVIRVDTLSPRGEVDWQAPVLLRDAVRNGSPRIPPLGEAR